jgi:hypothetical protein
MPLCSRSFTASSVAAMSSGSFRYMIATVLGCTFWITYLEVRIASRAPFAWQGNMYGS